MKSRMQLLLLPSVVALVAALAILASGQAPRTGPALLVAGLTIIVLGLPPATEGRLRDAPAALISGFASGILFLAAYRFLLHGGLTEGAAVACALLLAALLPALDGMKDRGGALPFLPLVLVLEPGVAILLPRKLETLQDPVRLLLMNLAAGALLATTTGFALLRAGQPRTMLASGVVAGSGLGLHALVTDRWPDAVALALASCGLAGCLALLGTAGRRPGLLRKVVPIVAPAALGAVILRVALPWSHGLAPSTYGAGDVRIQRYYALDSTLLQASAAHRRASAINGSLSSFLLLPGEVGVFSGAPLALSYGTRTRSVLVVGSTAGSEAALLAASGRVERIVAAQPSPLPLGPPLLVGAVPLPPGDPFDVVIVNVTSRSIAATLPALPAYLASDGILVMRRFGPIWEEHPEGLALRERFAEQRLFWNSERSGVTVLANHPLAPSPGGIAATSAAISASLPVMGFAGLRLSGAWLALQPKGIGLDEREARNDLAALQLASGDPFNANIALGSDTPASTPYETMLRALIHMAMGDPTEEGRHRRFAAEALATDPANPYFRRVARAVGLPSPESSAAGCPALVFRQLYDEVPAWSVAGPFPVRRIPPGDQLLTAERDDRLAPATSEVEARPRVGERVYGDAASFSTWQLSTPRIRADSLRTVVPFDIAGAFPETASCAYAYTELQLDGPRVLEIWSERTAHLWIDGRPVATLGSRGLLLPAGHHRLLVKGFTLQRRAPAIAISLRPVRGARPDGGVRSVVEALPESSGGREALELLQDSFRGWISLARQRDRPGRVLVVELPPLDDALDTLELEIGGVRLALCSLEPAQSLGLGNPLRHAFNVGEIPAGARLVLRATVGGTPIAREIVAAPADAREVVVIPTTYEASPTADSQAAAIATTLRAVSRFSGSTEGLRFQATLPWTEGVERFLERCGPEEADALRLALSSGRIELGALHRPADRRLSTPQLELDELATAARVAASLGVESRAAIFGVPNVPPGLGEILAASGIRLVMSHASTSPTSPRLQGDPGGSAVPLVVALQPEGATFGRDLLADGPTGMLAALDGISRLGPGPLVIHAPVIHEGEPELLIQSIARFRRLFASPRVRIATPSSLLRATPPPGSLPTCCIAAERTTPDLSDPMGLATARADTAARSAARVFAHAAGSLYRTGAGGDGTSGDADPTSLTRDIGSRLPAGGPYAVVTNPLPHPRLEPVEVDGAPRVLEVPAMGYAAFDTTVPAASRGTAEADPDRGLIRNRSFEITIDAGGAIATIAAREAGFSILSRAGSSFLSVREIVEGEEQELPFRGPVRLEGDEKARTARIPIASPDGRDVRGTLELTLHAGVERLDARLQLDPRLVPAGARGVLVVDSDLTAPELVIEEAFGMRTVKDGAPRVMRGGLMFRSTTGLVAVASPDAAVAMRRVEDPGAATIVLYDATRGPLPEAPLVYRFGVAAHPAFQDVWSPFAFFRAFELPMVATVAAPTGAEAGAALPPLPMSRSLLRVEPSELELLLRTAPAPGDHRLDLLVHNASDRERKQKIVFPDQESYLLFPIAPNELLKLQIERP